MNEANRFRVPILRNAIEYVALVAWWLLWAYVLPPDRWSPWFFSVIVIVGCWFKTIFFGTENLTQLYAAAREDLSHHRFLILTEIVLAFVTVIFLLSDFMSLKESINRTARECQRESQTTSET